MPTRGSSSNFLCPKLGWPCLGAWLVVAVVGLLSHSPVLAQAQAVGPIRVEPASLLIDQQCQSTDTTTPHLSLSASSVTKQGGSLAIGSPFRVAGDGQGATGLSLELKDGAFEQLREAGQVAIQDFVLERGRTVNLELRRMESFSNRTIFAAGTASGDRRLAVPEVALLAGTVKGVPGSTVFLGVSRHGINGYIRIGDTMRVVSSGPPSLKANGLLARMTELSAFDLGRGNPWRCGVSEASPIRPEMLAGAGGVKQDSIGGMRICNVAIDCDDAFFTEMGGNETVALEYVATLIAAISNIYERDLQVALRLTYARVWTVEDPYQTCGYDGLLSFQSQFNPPGVKPHVKYKFSGCGGAGASLGTLPCPTSENPTTPVAASRVLGYFPFPVASSDSTWDLYVVAHEIGHIFGSSHTHCYDPPLDHCYNTEGTCYNGPVECTRGSIMSYCNACGGMSNIDFEFPPAVVARMQPFIERACMEVSEGSLFVHNDGASVLEVDSIISTAPWMVATRSAFLVAPHDSQGVVVVPDWDAFTDLQQTGRLLVYCAGLPSAQSVQITANRVKPLPEFSAAPLSGCAPLAVRLTDETVGLPSGWKWNFGDDSTSALQHPTHVYTEPGIYVIRLTASSACGPGVSPDSAVVVVYGPACHFDSPIIVNRDDSLIGAYDLWLSIGKMTSSPDRLKFEIAANTRDSCGARIDGNRFLSVAPLRGWAGNSTVTIRTTDPAGCVCEARILVIINVPPTIEIDIPEATIITNHRVVIAWNDTDPNDDAKVMLYRSDSASCLNPIGITGKPLSEDADGHAGYFEWYVAGVPDGRYYVRAVINDPISSEASCSQGAIVVDLTPPVTSITMTCAELDSNGWCRAEGLVALPATDNLSGIARTTYRVNRSGWARYTRPFRVKSQGPSLIEYFSTDVAGNAEPVHSAVQPYKIDTRPPYITSLSMDNARFVDGDYMSAMPSFSFQLVDDGSGINVARVLVSILPGTAAGPLEFRSGSPGFSYDTTTFATHVTVPAPLTPGAQTMTINVADDVGNTALLIKKFMVGDELRLGNVVPFPNPARGPMEFTFTLTQDAGVSIRVYDLSGNLVRKMENIECKAGYNAVPWDGWSDGYGILASGAYVYEITARNSQGSVNRLDKLAVIR